MKKILITGATGNVGIATIRHLYRLNHTDKIVAGLRDPQQAGQELAAYPGLGLRTFNFTDSSTFSAALQDIDTLFLLRPP